MIPRRHPQAVVGRHPLRLPSSASATSFRLLLLLLLLLLLGVRVVRASLFSPQDVPGPPERVLLSPYGDAALRVQFTPPARTAAEGNNGAPVLGYKVEVARRVDEVQTLAVGANGPIAAGGYRLTFTSAHGPGGASETTACVAWNASALALESALEELGNVDSVRVTRSAYGAVAYGFVYTIAFDGPYLVSGPQPELLAATVAGCAATLPASRTLTFRADRVVPGAQGPVPEVWEITTTDTAGTAVLGGGLDLSLGFVGDWTDTLVTATVAPGSRTAVTSASLVGRVNRGDSIRLGGDEFTVHPTAPFTDTELPLDAYSPRGLVAPVSVLIRDTALGDVAVTQNSATVGTSGDLRPLLGVGEHLRIGQREFAVAAITGTTVTVTNIAPNGPAVWPEASAPHITAYRRKKVTVSATADAQAMRRALNGLPGAGLVDVSRVGPTATNGFRWRVTFQSLGTRSNCPESPCLRADKVTGTTTQLTDVFGAPCATCTVTASLIRDDSNNVLTGLAGAFGDASIVATHEIGGVVDEVQTLSTRATSADLRGSFAVNFRNTFAQTPGAVLNYDDTAADVQTKLQNLPTVGRLNVTRSDNAFFGFTWTITFLSNMGDQPLFLVDTATLLGTGSQVVVQELVKGVDAPFEAIVDGLSSDHDYYVRAFARNLNGYGSGTDALQIQGKGALPQMLHLARAPDPVQILGTWPVSGTELGIRLAPPDAHGAPILRYSLEFALGDAFGVIPIKRLQIFHPVEFDIAGTFQLQYGDATTPLLGIHTTADGVRDALAQIPSLRPVAVTRAPYVVTGTTPSRVVSFAAAANKLTTTALSARQVALLPSGATIVVGPDTFTIRSQPTVGATSVIVNSGHGVADYTADRSILVVDPTGAQVGPCGYEWTISFPNEIEQILHGSYPGLQVLSSLSSVEGGSAITTFGITDKQVAVPPNHYGRFDISTNDVTCDTYVIGAPSEVQVLQLFASKTITQGTFQLQLGDETTSCITLGTLNAKSNIKTALEALNYVTRVSVEEQRRFKVLVLKGTSTSRVSAYTGAQNKITVTALGAGDVAVLLANSIIQVSRNPNDFTRHSCEFTIATTPVAGDTEIAVNVVGTCADFTSESRTLRLLDFHDYQIRFWGSYPTGAWPTLQVVKSAFGLAPCAVWAPAVPVYSKIHSVKYEGLCANGHRGIQTIVADADTAIGGYFTLSYMGKETDALGFQTTTAAAMRSALEMITTPGSVNVTVSQFGVNGKAWRITFLSHGDTEDLIYIKHTYLTGQDVLISVYPTVELFSDALQDDISGTFQLAFAGQVTEPIGFSATHAKVVQELQKLVAVDSVIALGGSGDVGVTSLKLTASATTGSSILTNVQLDSKTIDPTRFLAVREKLVIGTDVYWIKSVSTDDITLTATFAGATGSVTVNAGLITRQVKPLPGFVGISGLMRVITATTGSSTFELPPDHGFAVNNVFFISGQKLTVTGVTNGIITTAEVYTGVNVESADPILNVYDNKLRTTSDLSPSVSVGDELWIESATGDMLRYTVSAAPTSRILPVDGVFPQDFIRSKVFHISIGRRWTLVFRSYDGNLETFDAIPGNDWRGTAARLGTRHPNAVAANTFSVGNPAVQQTVLLDADALGDVGGAATFTLTFGSETTQPIAWTATATTVKQSLEALDGIDGVTVTTVAAGNGFLHTIDFWGTYTLSPKLPTLMGKIANAVNPAKCSILIRDTSEAPQTKRDHVILKSEDDFVFRVFAHNSKGISDVPGIFHAETSTRSVIPTPPTSVVLGEYRSPTTLSVNYRPPVYTGGAEITMYRLEWDSSSTFDSASSDYGVMNIQKQFEVQQVLTTYRSDANMGGTFTLSWGGRTSSNLPFDCSEAQMTDALALLTDTTSIAVDPVKVRRARVSWGYSWKITFLHTPGDLASLVADGSLMTGDFPRIGVSELTKGVTDLAIGDFTHEVQEVHTDAKSVLSGSFKLEFEGKVTASISVDASALEMQDALQAITMLYSIKVTRSWRNQIVNSAVWSVTFAYLEGEEMVGAGNIFLITIADSSSLVGAGASVGVANKITGSDPFRYTITGLRPGVQYYFHAMAYNAQGFGSATSPMSSAMTCGQPGPPGSVVASVVDGTTLAVSWAASSFTGGCPIDKYKVEWYRSAGIQEEQTITTSAGKGIPEIQSIIDFADSQSLSGYFKLSFGGESTENIAWNAPATGLNSIKERLERLSTVGTVDVTRLPSTRVIGGFMVTVSGHTVTEDASGTVTLANSGVAVGDTIWILNQPYVVQAKPSATTLTVDGSLTTSVAVPVFRTAYGYQWLVTFQAGHVGPQELLKVTTSDSWAGNNPGIYVDSVQKGLQPISGTFRVSFATGGLSHITPPLAHNATADEMKAALEGLITLSAVNVTRSTNGFGFNWLVTFTCETKDEISLLGVDSTALHGPSVRISTARTNVGVQPGFYCEQKDVPGAPAVVTMPGSLRYGIGNLRTGQSYAIRVRAHNSEGYGPASYISPSFQVPRTIPSAPTDVKLLVLSSRQLKVRWSQPTSNGGSAITAYRIQWDTTRVFANVDSPSFDSQGDLRVQPTDVGPFFFNMPIVTPGTYFVRVLAINDQGVSLPTKSDPESATPADRTPGQPENVKATVLSSYAVLVEWEASSTQKPYYGGDGGLPITQYMIEWDSSSAFDSPASFGLVDGTKRSFIIGGNDAVTGVRSNILIPGIMYSIRVTAFNARGAGTPKVSNPAAVIASNQAPTVPRNLQLSVIPSTSIQARWDNPLYDGGSSLKSYQVEWDEQDDFSSGQSSQATIPIVREMQSLTVSSDVVNEEQLIDATVEVINEVQVLRTTFSGADEIQVIETTNLAVVDEVQTVTTSATDRDEVQELRLDADDVNEIQAIRSTMTEVFEVQTIQVGAVRKNEEQSISITLPGSDLTLVSGTLTFSFDNTICTHCTLAVGYRRTTDLLTALTSNSDTTGATTVENALEFLDNIDDVTVTRASSTAASGELTYVFSITFSGDGVAGNVPELVVASALKYNNVAVGGVTTLATEVVSGNEVTFDPASVFKITHTCESYSDPYTITTFSTACTPTVANRLCTACVTAFDGTTFTIAGTNLVGTVVQNDRLIAGTCVFEVDQVTTTTVTVLANDVGVLCSSFSAQTLPLYKAVTFSTTVPLKTDATTISDATVVENLLNTIIDSVTITRTQSITSTFVGSLYDVTFRKRTGKIPLMICDKTAIQVTSAGGTAACAVTRSTIGSMIYGTFTVSLARESDGTVVASPSMPWDASEALMTSTLESVVSNGEQVFGTVNVKRTVYSPTANKWSGGYTWQIEFTSRGWNIPKMTVTSSLTPADPAAANPTIVVEDADSPLNPFAGSRHGNQIGGTITMKFGGITAAAMVIGTDTDISNLHTTVTDATMAAFIAAKLTPAVPSVQVTRSPATQSRGFTWTITFSDPATGGDIPMLELPITQLTGQNVRANVFETIKGNQLGGTFQLKFNGETTGPILFSADKTAVQAQLNSLASIKPSSVLVDRTGPAITGTNQVLSYTWLITFRSSVWADPTSDHSSGIAGNWKGARAKWDDVWAETGYSKAWGRHVGPMATKGFQISCIKDGLTTTANDNSQDCQTQVQTPGVGPIKGTFTIALDSTNAGFMFVKQAATSGPIAHNAWATKEESGATGTSVEEILEQMLNIGDVAVSRSPVNPQTGGYTWTVTFLREKSGKCDQEEIAANGMSLCNSPGDVPAMTADATGLSGATPTARVCEKTVGNCYPNVVQNGKILRGDFTTFKVTGDPGFDQRYTLTIACPGNAAPPCNPVQFFNIPANSKLPVHLFAKDRFTLGTYSSCVFTVKDVTTTQVEVIPYTCAAMVAGMTNTARSVNILVPWNGDEDLVRRVLEASSDLSKEVKIWSGGRKVRVSRTIHGKYGEVSWQVQFISNPSYTPPGAGNIPDIQTVFAANPTAPDQITVTQITPGSVGLSGSFLVDFHSTFGARDIHFDESEDRLQRKLNEMNTIGRVIVKKFQYPSITTGCTDSSCSGGWDNQPVDNPGTRGGYRWRIRFMKVTGEYGGLTFPSGSGNVGPLSVTIGSLQGNEKSVDVTTTMPGSVPILGGFILNTSAKATPVLPYSSSADSIKQGIESMNLFGEVDVTQDFLLSQRIPNAVATISKDGTTATINGIDDIRQYLAPGDLVRFGPSAATNLPGSNGDSPITGVVATSTVTVDSLSPIVQAPRDVTNFLYPSMQIRIDGLVYSVQRSGQEIQTVAVTLPVGSWDPNESRPYFKLQLSRGGSSQTSPTCFAFDVDAGTVANTLKGQLQLLDPTAATGDIKVTRSGPTLTENDSRKGYVFSVYFAGTTVTGDVAKLVSDNTGCTAITGATVVITTLTHGGKIGHQRISLATDSGQVLDTTGYFKLGLNAQTTGCLKWGIPAEDLETQLETTLSTGNVLVARRGSGQSLTEIQRLRMTSNSEVTSPATGLFQLAFTLDGKTSWTGCLAYGVSAEDMQLALNQLGNVAVVVPHIFVARDGDGTSAWGYGYEYTIQFKGPVIGGFSSVLGNINQLEVLNVGTSPCAKVLGGDPALIMETVREGRPGFSYDIFFLNSPKPYAPKLALVYESTAQCATGWTHSGGSVRKASLDVVEIGGSGEVQTLLVYDASAVIAAGSYKLSFGGVSTNCIDFDDSAATVETELVGLSSIGTAGVLVSRDAHPVLAPNGFIYQITFVGELTTGNVPKLDVVTNDPACTAFAASTRVTVTELTAGGQAPGEFVMKSLYDGEKPGQHVAYSVSQVFSVMKEQIEAQQIIVKDANHDITANGAYKLTLLGQTTALIDWDATEDELEAALQVPGVTAGDVIVSRRTDTTLAPNGYVYTVYFSGDSVKGNLDVMTSSGLTGMGTGQVLISVITDGVDGIAPFLPQSIPLAQVTDAKMSTAFISSDATASVFKVNGFLWTIKFKSTIGDLPMLGSQAQGLTGKLTVLDNFVKGSASNSYVIANLMSGINYFVRVAASTDVGTGAFTDTKSIVPSGLPSSVQNLAAGYALNVREVQEVRLAATHITEVQSITTSAAKMAEVQTLRTYASADACFDGNCIKGRMAFRLPTIQTIKVSALAPITAGSFSIHFVRYVADGANPGQAKVLGTTVDTVKINWNAAASDVATALAALDAIDASDIIVTRDGDASSAFGFGYIYSITFIGNTVAGETEALTVKDSASGCGTCDAFVTTGGVTYSITTGMNSGQAMGTDTAVQEIIVTASKPLYSGSYKLSFNHLGAAVVSSCINFDAPARGSDVRAMENILNGMSNIDKVYVTRSLDPVRAPNGFVYLVFFYGNLVYGAVNDLTWATCTAFQTQENNALTQNGVNADVRIRTVDPGGFTVGNTFVDAATATAAQLEQDLDRLPVFGDVIATQSLVDQQGGYVWTVAFKDSEGNLPQFICAVDATFAATASTSCEVTTLTDGNALSGSFVVESSVPIAFDASAVMMKAALEAMAWVGTVQVVRSGPTAQMGFTWTITFLDYFGDVPPLLVTSSLVGTGSSISIQEIRKGNNIGGTFTLSYLSSTTAPIAWNAKATATDSGGDGSSFQEKLEALDVVGPLQVSRSIMDQEGGYTWQVTFMDNKLNPGDLPLLQGNASRLTGIGVVVAIREVTKGSNAAGDQLWVSFDPPATDNGDPITKYLTRWDTSAAFTASPAEFAITEPEKLYQHQSIKTGAPSLAWSRIRATPISEVQVITIAAGATAGDTFKLKFRGVSTGTFTIGTSTSADLLAELNALSSIGTVVVNPTTGTLLASTVFKVTFTTEPGDLPYLISDTLATATVAEEVKGVANFRKEVVVFKCVATTGVVTFSYGPVATQDIAFDATLAIATTQLHTLFGAETGSIRVLSTQPVLCAAAAPAAITIVFDQVYGDLNLQIVSQSVGTTITRDTSASVDGIYNDVVAKMSGTFQVGYKGEYTRSLNAESSATDVRYALEDLSTIQTVGVTREPSHQPLPGLVDVVNGQIFVTCSLGETCDFKRASYGLPGHQIRISGTWYTIRADSTQQDDLDGTRLYLGDLNGREVGFQGETRTRVAVSEWTKGYVWHVQMLSVAMPLGYLRAKIPRLYPADATVSVSGSACNKCYYIPTQTTKKLVMGQPYFIDVTAFNANGRGALPANGPVQATPSQVPNAPSNVDLKVLSGQEIEVFFGPPALAATNVHPDFNNDISSYIVQWDIKNDFKHGLPICESCATSLKINVLLVSQSLLAMAAVGTKFTIGDDHCVLEVQAISASRIDVVNGHNCNNFNARAYPMYYYTFEPAILSGLQIQGSPPFRYTIAGLTVSTLYYVRVAAVNSVPVQKIALDGNPPNNRKWSYAYSATTKDKEPDAPISVYLFPYSGTTLEVQIQPPTRDGKGQGGAAITHFWVDVDTVSTFDSPTKVAPVDVPVGGGDIPVLYPGGPRVYYIKNLQTGVRYFVQVKAKNSIGYSLATLAPNPLAPTRNPDGPVNVKVATVTTSPTPIDAATVTWQKPLTNGGLPITSYKVEWWGAESRPEIQVIEIKWTTAPTAAPFKLAFGGGQTGDMPFDVTAENLRSALMNIVVGGALKVPHVMVSRSTVNIVQGFQWRVTFAASPGDQPMIQFEFVTGAVVGGAGVTGRVFEAQSGIAVPQVGFPGQREVQVLVTSHPTTTVGGYFRVSYKGSAWSNYLPAGIAAADLKLALEALPTIGRVTVNLQGPSQNGQIWTITFESAVGNIPALTVDASKITPAGAFVGVKDGDNAVDRSGVRCVPGEDICPGTWGTFKTGIAALASIGEAAVEYKFYETIDASTLTYKITGLTPGKTYYVAVTAKNALGLGARVKSTPTAIVPPVQVPGLPTSVSVDVNPGVATQLRASWDVPTSDGGGEVRMYRIEYDPSPLFKNRGQQDVWCPTAPTPAVWKVDTYRVGNTGSIIGNGYFTLVLTRQNRVLTTEAIPWNAVAMAADEVGDGAPALSKVFCTDCPSCTDICDSKPAYPYSRRELSGSLQSKLEHLTTVNSVQVVRSPKAADGGYTWTITFQDLGDDFVLAPDATDALNCVDNNCGGGDYRVRTTKITAGIQNPPCVGSTVIPAIGALNKGQLYYVRVFAFNKIGFSLPALAASPQKPMVAPGPPTGVTLQVLTVSELKVLFSPPDDDGGDTVTQYLVEWATNNAFTNAQSGDVTNLSGGAPYARIISGLVKGTYYFVRVKARNSQGYGQYQISSPTSLNPYTTPSAPTQVTLGITASTMLTVQWNVPDDDGGDAISAYVVQWDISAGFDSLGADTTKAKITDVTQRAYTITLLTPGTVYYVRVRAMNAGGLGTPQTATPTQAVPVNTRPGKPHTLQAAPTANTGELLVTWQAPRVPAHGIPCAGTQLVPLACPIYVGLDVVFGGSSLESYLVQWSDQSDFTGFNWQSVTTTSAVLTGLDSGKLYYVRVLTVNSEGQKSDFCTRANANGYLCPDNLVLLDGNIVTGTLVSATPK